ncbi:ATP-binding protein [Brevibacillus laterosporus]|uniref:ATP-binding protein n=1 Tax=Brevibacillus laterosporus TaxID=1465 RepID=UPI00215BD33A|nr:ATP-binding protein [Brevibacillus laterosporus]MCR8994584.1 ATP-binding protein [Brevibacillus laterosporus]
MINVLNIQPNQPRAILFDYIFLVYGVGKAGKTTLFYKLAQTDYIGGLDKALLIGFEKGFKALRGIHAVAVPSENPEEKRGAWEQFQEVVGQLVENRGKVSYKFIAFDTLDYMYKYATEYIIKRERIARKDAKIKAINDVPWGQGHVMVEEEVDKQIKRLVNAGYGLFMITHDKEKKIELKNGQSYDKTTVTLPERARNLFVNMSDFIIYISIDKEVVNGLVNENRYIHFRSDGDIEAGSRFENVPNKIEYDVDLFLETFEKAVLEAYDGDEKAVDTAKQTQEQEREEKALDYVQEEASNPEKTSNDYIVQIDALIGKMNKDQKEQLKVELKAKVGSINYKKYTEIEQFEKGLAVCNQILN